MRATRSDDVVFEDAAIPLEHAVDVVPASELRLTAAQTAFAAWNGVLIGAIYHGVARAARDWLGRYLNERVPSNLGAPLASLPRFQESFGRIAAQVEISDGLLRDAAAAVDAGGDPVEVAGRANLVKLTVTNAAIDIALEAVRLVGNPGLLRTQPARAPPAQRPPRPRPHPAGRHDPARPRPPRPRRRRHVTSLAPAANTPVTP